MSMASVKQFAKRNTILPIIAVFIIAFSIFVNGFFNGNNFVNIIEQNSAEGIMVIGMTFLIINGYFDLSVGTLMGLCASLAVGLQPLGVLPAVLIALLVGFAVGMINGLLVAKVGINAFVVTLASMLGVRGFLYLYTQEQAIVGISDAFGDFGSGNFLGIPNLIIVFAVLLVIAQLVLRYTKHGRNTYATGGNENSASNAGINTQKTTIINFVICSLCAAAAGILYASKMNAATPTLGWPDTNVMVIAAVVLGGTKLVGGYGNMWFSLGGVMTIGIIENAMNLLNVKSYYNTLITGVILIVVLYLDKILKPNTA